MKNELRATLHVLKVILRKYLELRKNKLIFFIFFYIGRLFQNGLCLHLSMKEEYQKSIYTHNNNIEAFVKGIVYHEA